MICWPLYAEQRINKVLMVEEMKVGVVIEGYGAELVKAEEVETKVRLVMASHEGEELRQRVMSHDGQGDGYRRFKGRGVV
jgi:hypothetical protein